MTTTISTQGIQASLNEYISSRQAVPNRGRTYLGVGPLKDLTTDKMNCVSSFLKELKPLESREDLTVKLKELGQKCGEIRDTHGTEYEEETEAGGSMSKGVYIESTTWKAPYPKGSLDDKIHNILTEELGVKNYTIPNTRAYEI